MPEKVLSAFELRVRERLEMDGLKSGEGARAEYSFYEFELEERPRRIGIELRIQYPAGHGMSREETSGFDYDRLDATIRHLADEVAKAIVMHAEVPGACQAQADDA